MVCKTCGLNSSNLFFYSKFGTIIFILFGLSFAFIATVDISEIEITYGNYFDNIWMMGICAWIVYKMWYPSKCEI